MPEWLDDTPLARFDEGWWCHLGVSPRRRHLDLAREPELEDRLFGAVV